MKSTAFPGWNGSHNCKSVLYKTFTDEYPSARRIENQGGHKMLLADDHHATIIEPEVFEKVQAAKAARRRKAKAMEWQAALDMSNLARDSQGSKIPV